MCTRCDPAGASRENSDGEALSRFEEYRIVEQVQRLQRRVRSVLAAGAGDVRVRRIEGHQHRIRRGALEVDVEAATILVRSLPLSGHLTLFPYPSSATPAG